MNSQSELFYLIIINTIPFVLFIYLVKKSINLRKHASVIVSLRLSVKLSFLVFMAAALYINYPQSLHLAGLVIFIMFGAFTSDFLVVERGVYYFFRTIPWSEIADISESNSALVISRGGKDWNNKFVPKLFYDFKQSDIKKIKDTFSKSKLNAEPGDEL